MGTERFKVRVKDGDAVGGLSASGVRIRVRPGTYEVYWLSINRPGSVELEAALRFLDALDDGGHLDVLRAERPELQSWPELPMDGRFELIHG